MSAFDPLTFASSELGGKWAFSEDGTTVYSFMFTPHALALKNISDAAGLPCFALESAFDQKSVIAVHVDNLKRLQDNLSALRGDFPTIQLRMAAEAQQLVENPTTGHLGRLLAGDIETAKSWLNKHTGLIWEINAHKDLDGLVLTAALPAELSPVDKIRREEALMQQLRDAGLSPHVTDGTYALTLEAVSKAIVRDQSNNRS